MRDRIAKLRAMAEHPTSNPHEAAIAREEMERLIAAHPESQRLTWTDVGHSSNVEEFMARYAAMERQENERVKSGWDIEDPEAPSATSGEIITFARNLKIGEKARTRHSTNWLIYDGPALRSEILTLTRRTKGGILVMSDGSRFNIDGYKRGETGSDGHRTYLVRP